MAGFAALRAMTSSSLIDDSDGNKKQKSQESM